MGAIFLKELADLVTQLLFHGDQCTAQGAGGDFCTLVLLQIALEGFDTHVAAVGDDLRDALLGAVRRQLGVGLDGGHLTGHRMGLPLLAAAFFQHVLYLASDPFVLLAAGVQQSAHLRCFGVVPYTVQGVGGHFDPGVTFFQQRKGILIGPVGSSLKYLGAFVKPDFRCGGFQLLHAADVLGLKLVLGLGRQGLEKLVGGGVTVQKIGQVTVVFHEKSTSALSLREGADFMQCYR